MPNFPARPSRGAPFCCLLSLVVLCFTGISLGERAAGDEVAARNQQPIARALAFLEKQVPAWRPGNHCYSCHNNGDGARALYMAQRLGYSVNADALTDTTDWLRRPEQWETNGEEGGSGGQLLAAIQFGAALVESTPATERGGAPLEKAASLIVAGQEPDGSWTVNANGVLGSPVTYGRYLATATALRTLRAAGSREFQPQIAKAEAWLIKQKPKATVDVAGTLLGLEHVNNAPAQEQRDELIKLLATAQDESGGWGPYVNAAPEPFDTAIAVLALSHQKANAARNRSIARGRQFLIDVQLDDGSWPETTRPANAVSYAQRISTTAWVALALMESRGVRVIGQ
jgi:hypothetical protein